MSWQRVYLAVGLFGVLLLLTNADNSVHILSKYQLITSTTLNWLPRSHYDPSRESREIVVAGFENEDTEDNSFNNHAEKSERKRPLYVCRVLHMSVRVAGTQRGDEQRCTVTIHGNVKSYESYELLENVDNAGRVNWEQWDKYKTPPLGSVATEKTMFVARYAAERDNDSSPPRYTHYIGTLTTYDILGSISYVKDDGTEGTVKSGDILVETEPIRYDLTRVKLNWPKKRVIERTPVVLGEATITNKGPKPANMAQAFGYTFPYSMYWGQGRAILKGLNTTITLTNGTALPTIMWGMTESANRTEVYTVDLFLEPGTGINITLRANHTSMEVPYLGTLISHYEDGETRSRVISGIRSEVTMFDIKPELGPIYFLSNYSLVPTTTMPPTTEPTSTTPTPPPQYTIKDTRRKDTEQRDTDETTEEEHDDNMIVVPKKSDMNMQSDDGGPLSLKNNVESTRSGAQSLLRLNGLLLLIASIVHRIT